MAKPYEADWHDPTPGEKWIASRPGRFSDVKLATKQRQDDYLVHLRATGGKIKAALRSAGRSDTWLYNRRRKDPEFAAREQALRLELQRVDFEPRGPFEGTFAQFRLQYFNMDTLWFQSYWVTAMENLGRGQKLLALWPPETGKSTIFEDWVSMLLALDPSYMFLVGTETPGLGSKFIGRIRDRMEEGSTLRRYVDDFGPFAPQTGARKDQLRKGRQPWGTHRMSVYRKFEVDSDDRNFSIEALGIMQSVEGNRTKHLHLDDIQTRKNLDLTDKIDEVTRQSWLSRPGVRGKKTVNGTRAGEGDIYERWMEEWDEDQLKVIKFPMVITDHVTGQPKPLWEFNEDTGMGWTMEDCEKIRVEMGEEIWARTYMQEPGAHTQKAFTDEVIGPCLLPLLSVEHVPQEDTVLWLSVDPALGSYSCVTTLEPTPDHLAVRHIRERQGLQSNEEVMIEIERAAAYATQAGARVDRCIIEHMGYQKALKNDRRLQKIADDYGFEIEGHLTGINKYDDLIGVASMPSSMLKGEIILPYADDAATQHEIGQLIRQMKAWKINKDGKAPRGSRLRQDRLMTLWFAWIQWKELRHSRTLLKEKDRKPPMTRGIPFHATGGGILVPSRMKRVKDRRRQGDRVA